MAFGRSGPGRIGRPYPLPGRATGGRALPPCASRFTPRPSRISCLTVKGKTRNSRVWFHEPRRISHARRACAALRQRAYVANQCPRSPMSAGTRRRHGRHEVSDHGKAAARQRRTPGLTLDPCRRRAHDRGRRRRTSVFVDPARAVLLERNVATRSYSRSQYPKTRWSTVPAPTRTRAALRDARTLATPSGRDGPARSPTTPAPPPPWLPRAPVVTIGATESERCPASSSVDDGGHPLVDRYLVTLASAPTPPGADRAPRSARRSRSTPRPRRRRPSASAARSGWAARTRARRPTSERSLLCG